MCGPGQSYTSTGRGLTLIQEVAESTVVAGLTWLASYEFVSGGREEDCHTEYRSRQAGGSYNNHQEFGFSSPRNVFLYGRGGRENITCRIKMIGSPNQRVQIKFSNISMKGRSCKTVLDSSLGQYRCEVREGGRGVAGVFITEVEGETETDQQCHCGVMHNTLITSTTNVILLTFRVTGMLPSQDWRDFLMTGSFRFISSHCQDPTVGRGGGEVGLELHSSDQALCDRSSWAARARQGAQLYLAVPGVVIPHHAAHVCSHPGRVIVRTEGRLVIICPGTHTGHTTTVPVMSGLSESSNPERLQSVSVQLAGRWSHSFSFSWLELEPLSSQSGLTGSNIPPGQSCPLVCPSLAACISPSLECDGAADCPGGWDEQHCPHLTLPIYYLYGLLVAALVVFLVTAIILLCRSQQPNLKSTHGKQYSWHLFGRKNWQ